MAHKRKTVTDLEQRVVERKIELREIVTTNYLWGQDVDGKVYNIKAYLLAALFNAGATKKGKRGDKYE